MPRTLRDSSLETRAARARLAPRGKPYYRLIDPGLHLGYRKPRGRKRRAAASGKWVVRYYLGGQSYRVEIIGTADDYGDADGVVLNWSQAQSQARKYVVQHTKPSVGGPLTVRAAVETYLGLEGRKSTGDAAKRAAAHVYPQLGDVLVSALTAEQLRRWQTALAKSKPRLRTKAGEQQQYREIDSDDETVRKRRASANRTWTVLRAALNHAFNDGLVPSDTAWRRVKPFKNVDAARVHYLTVAEAKRLINAADQGSGSRDLIRAALLTGCRYGELCRLVVADFDPDAGTLAIRQSKSGKARTVHLSVEGRAFFKQLAAGRSGGQLLVCKSDGSAWRPSEQARPMAAAVAHARITKPISFHALRHSYASLATMSGMPLLVLAKNLGHADTRMVEKHYGHLSASYVAESVREHAPQFGFKPDRRLASLAKS